MLTTENNRAMPTTEYLVTERILSVGGLLIQNKTLPETKIIT